MTRALAGLVVAGLAGVLAAAPPASATGPAVAWDTMRVTWNKPFSNERYRYLSNSGVPIGNGRSGVRIKGGADVETWQINDTTFWSGTPNNRTDPARRTALEECRQRLVAGDIPGANGAAQRMWGDGSLDTYLPMGTMSMRMDQGKEVKDYLLTLDLDRATCQVAYTADGIRFQRESFASFPDRVVVSRIQADRPGSVSCTIALAYPEEMEGHGAQVSADGDRSLVMAVRAPFNRTNWHAERGIRGEVRLTAIPSGGRISAAGDRITVSAADGLVLVLSTATDYRDPFTEPGTGGSRPGETNRQRIDAVAGAPYERLLGTHVGDYQALFRRLWAEVNGKPADPAILKMQYARYDMIACSRSGDRPHNQQGMWNSDWRPPNECGHFLNENLEKHYGIIETLNLPETGDPLWNYMDELAVNGAKTASVDWGFHGWTAGHCSDIWAATHLNAGNNAWALWPMGGVWLCNNLWDHYAFGQDRTFLRDRAYPLLAGASAFCLDLLIDNGKGKLVAAPTSSPENVFVLPDGKSFAVSMGSTCDMSLIRELFRNTIHAGEILGVDEPLRQRLGDALERMPAIPVNAAGELQEWAEDYTRKEVDHRHASHLLGAWPLSVITERGTPDLFKAAQVALTSRGGGGFHPDKSAMWARLRNGDLALKALGGSGHAMAARWSVLCAGFSEMLLFSHVRDRSGNYELELLPALPTAWKSGLVRGLRARGGFEVDLEWADHRLKQASVRSITGHRCTLRYGTATIDLALDPGTERQFGPEDFSR